MAARARARTCRGWSRSIRQASSRSTSSSPSATVSRRPMRPFGHWQPGNSGEVSSSSRRPVARGPPGAVDSPRRRPMKIFACMLALLVVASAAYAQPAQIVISQPAEATTMDPGRSTQVLTVNYFVNLYDTLTRWDTALQLQPGLATSWKTVNETTWEFTLRPGVKFHDGAPFTAEDVKATLDRNMVPGKTVVTPGFTTIEAVQIVNPLTIRILTKKPDPLIAVRMAQMGSQILPARLTTEDGVKELARRPVGTGAYRFVEWVKDERLVMQANHEWWGWEGNTPGVERVIWKPIPDEFPRIVALE